MSQSNKRRYLVKKAPTHQWVIITNTKTNQSWWMHHNDFGITHKHLPEYCRKQAKQFTGHLE